MPPEQVRVGEAVHEEGDIARGRGIGAGVDDVMDVGAGRSGEEGVLEARKRFAIEAPVSFLGCDVSAHHLPLAYTYTTHRPLALASLRLYLSAGRSRSSTRW